MSITLKKKMLSRDVQVRYGGFKAFIKNPGEHVPTASCAAIVSRWRYVSMSASDTAITAKILTGKSK